MEITTPPAIQIERDPERRSGAPTLAGTRTAIHDIVSYCRLYEGDIQRVVEEALPHLTIEQVQAALAWYQDHQEEIDERLRRRRERYQGLTAQTRAAP